MAAVTVRSLDAQVKERLRIRAAVHGRSMESEIRAILAEAVSRPGDTDGPFVQGCDQLGLPIDGLDAQIASICRAHGAALATRNLKNFRHTDVNLIDPWQRP